MWRIIIVVSVPWLACRSVGAFQSLQATHTPEMAHTSREAALGEVTRALGVATTYCDQGEPQLGCSLACPL